MAVNSADAFEVNENGIVITDGDQNTIGYFSVGSGDPNGSSAPQNTWYFRQDTQTLFYKFGAGNNDWRQIRADDITSSAAAGTPPGADVESRLNAIAALFTPYDVSALTAGSADLTGLTDTQSVVAALANRHYGKDYDEQEKSASETTSGAAFATYDTLTFNVSDTSGANKYRFSCDFLWGHDSASNDIRVRLSVDGTPQPEMRVEPKDQGADQRIQNSLSGTISNLSSGSHTIALEYRPATASRVSSVYRSFIEVWRVE